jgi:hypothetical protein
MPLNAPADNFAVQYDPITNTPIVNNEILDLEVEKDVLTDDQITALLAKYSNSRALLFLYDARERLLKEGQENWNGDKKSFEVRFDFLTKEIARLEKVVAQERIAKQTGGQPNCPVTICKVTYE